LPENFLPRNCQKTEMISLSDDVNDLGYQNPSIFARI